MWEKREGNDKRKPLELDLSIGFEYGLDEDVTVVGDGSPGSQ